VWDARGWLPDGVAPSAIAAAHCRVFGMPAPRDPSKRTARAYSLRELGHALGELGRAFEPEPLRKVWRRALQRLELPSTRALIAQQARLMEVRGPVGMTGDLFVVVAVASDWLEAVKSRRRLLSDALADALGQPVAMALRGLQP
jgi:DNA polymerase-3 subunit gamma/tau